MNRRSCFGHFAAIIASWQRLTGKGNSNRRPAGAPRALSRRAIRPRWRYGLPALFPLLLPATVLAGPMGEQVAAGTAAVSRPDGATTIISQQTQKVVIDWQSFSVAQQERVNFQQPGRDSIALNRVIGNDPSSIYGTITANGQVFLVNPSGVLFAPGSQVSVHGLLATTHNIGNDDFLAGRYIFSKPEGILSNAEVINQGNLAAGEGGYIALAGDYAANAGVIQARLGQVALASGNRFTIDLDGDQLIGLAVNEASLAERAGVKNLGLIGADGGRVVMTAQVAGELATTVINNEGLIQARSIVEANGEIILRGGDAGVVANTGILDATAPATGRGGNIEITGGFVALGGTIDASGASGGSITVEAGTLSLADRITATGSSGTGGTVDLEVSGKTWESSTSLIDVSGADGGSITHFAGKQVSSSGSYRAQGSVGQGGSIDLSGWAVKLLSAHFDASGESGGGRIRFGGEWQGGKELATDEIPNAQTLAANDGVTITADGRGPAAAGGEVVLWADRKTAVYADISTRPMGAGSGGNIEISSGDTLTFGGTAAAGIGGTVLFDPKNITIEDATNSASMYNLILGYNYEGSPDGINGIGSGERFGSSVSLNGAGNRLAVGARNDGGSGNSRSGSGAVYLFTFADGNFSGGSLAGTIGYGYTGGNNVDVPGLDSGDSFGSAVSLNGVGDRLAVGAPYDAGFENSMSDSGAVHLFSFADGNFSTGSLAGTIGYGYTDGNNVDAPGLDSGDMFGSAVSLNGVGDRLAVGAFSDAGFENSLAGSGAVHLFSFADGNFNTGSLAGTLGYGYSGGSSVNISLLGLGDYFGSAVSLNGIGDRLAVGAPYDAGFENSMSGSGAVYLFSFTDANFSTGSLAGTIGYGYTGGNNMEVPGLESWDMFGSAVSLNGVGDRLAVGAPYDDGFANGISGSGALHLFSFADGNFSTGSLTSTIGYGYTGGNNVDVPGLESWDYFGSSVSLNGAGDRLAVGAHGDDGFENGRYDSGAVHLFSFTDANFSTGSLAGTIGYGYSGGNNVDVQTVESGDLFGYAVSLNSAGDRLAVGAQCDDGFENSRYDSGAGYLFSFTDASFRTGSLTGIMGYGYTGGNNVNLSALASEDQLGSAVSLNNAGDRLAVGAFGDSMSDTGAVYLFTFTDGNFSGGSLAGIMGKGYSGGNNVDVPTLETSDWFGRLVSMNGTADRLAVGAFGDDGFGNSMPGSGAVYLFSFTDGNFSGGSLAGTIGYGYTGGNNVNVSALASVDQFGFSVSLNTAGDRLAVGAFGDDGFGNSMSDTGAVYLFTFTDGNFSGGSLAGTIGYGYRGGNNVDVPGLDFGDYFGSSVALNNAGDRLVVGAAWDDGFNNGTPDSGAVHLFSFTDGNFSTGSLTGTIGKGYTGGNNVDVPGLEYWDVFGSSVSLNNAGNRLAVGAAEDNGFNNGASANGAVYLFSFADGNFSSGSLAGTIGKGYTGGNNVDVSALSNEDHFGSSVSLNDAGDRLAVGAPYDDGFGNSVYNGGAVYLFTFTDANFSSGSLTGTIGKGYTGGNNVDVPGLDSWDMFGSAVSLNNAGDRLAVGASMDAGFGNSVSGSGAVHLFTFTDANFSSGSLAGTIGKGYSGGNNVDVPGLDSGDHFGSSVALNNAGDRLVVGAPYDDGFGNSVYNGGAVYLLSFADGNFSTGSLAGTMGYGYTGSNNVDVPTHDDWDMFGSSASLNGVGDRLAAGAYGDDGFNHGASGTGAVYLFAWPAGTNDSLTDNDAFAENPNAGVTITPATLTNVLNTGSHVILQANNDITVNSAIVTFPDGVPSGGNLAMAAGRSILVNADIDLAGGALTLVADELAANGVLLDYRDAGTAAIDTTAASLTAGSVNMTNNSGPIRVGDISATSVQLGTPGGITISGTVDNSYGTTTLTGPTTLRGMIKNGTLLSTDATSTLTMSDPGTRTLDGVTIGSDLTTAGTLYIRHGLTLADGITVNQGNGRWYFDGYNTGEAAGTVLHLATLGTATLNSAGGGLSNYAYNWQTLQIDSGVTMQGYGSLLENWCGNTIINEGTIIANTTGQTFSISPTIFTNNGTLSVTAGAVDVAPATFTQSGTINVASDAWFNRSAGFTNTGTLNGGGTIAVGIGAAGLVNQGNIDPGGPGAAGMLTMSGELQFDAGSTLNIEMAGTAAGAFDRLDVTGNITMAGTLQAGLLAGYTPGTADGFSFLTMGGTATGTFSSATLPADFSLGYNLAAGEAARLVYETAPVVESEPVVESVPLPVAEAAPASNSTEVVKTVQAVLNLAQVMTTQTASMDPGLESPAPDLPQPESTTGSNVTAGDDNKNENEERRTEEVSLASTFQERPLTRQPIFDLGGGGVAGQNMVCK